MMPDPTFTHSEANRRIADAQALASAERLVRGTSDRPDRHGVISTLATAVRATAPEESRAQPGSRSSTRRSD